MVSLASPTPTSNIAQHVKKDFVSGLMGGPDGMYVSLASEMIFTNRAISSSAVSCSDITESPWVEPHEAPHTPPENILR